MSDTIPERGGEPEVDRYAIPEPVVDRYAIPEPDEIVPTYVRNEAPWVGIQGEAANPNLVVLQDAPAVPGAEPECTRIVRTRRKWRAAVAWLVTAAFALMAAWFLPVLLVPTTSIGRVGSFAMLSVGGLAAMVALPQTWRWAYRAE